MTTELQRLTEVGRRRVATRFSVFAGGTLLVVVGAAAAVDPTSRVGALVLAITLLAVMVGLLLAYALFLRPADPALAFAGLPARSRKGLMKRLLRGGDITDEELQVADGLLKAAQRPVLPVAFGVNALLQLALVGDRNRALHLLSGLGWLGGLTLILVRRRKLARRTDVADRAYRQQYSLR